LQGKHFLSSYFSAISATSWVSPLVRRLLLQRGAKHCIDEIFVIVGSTVLTNELGKKLPAEFLAQVPGGVSGAYAAIPLVADL
jgi:hypothetical protein